MTTPDDFAIPFIDRLAALRKLRDFCASPQGRCLAVIGRSGIGKSCLFRHFADLQHEGDEPERVVVLHEVLASRTTLQEYAVLDEAIGAAPQLRRLLGRLRMPDWAPSLVAWLRQAAAAADPAGAGVLLNMTAEALSLRVQRRDLTVTDWDIVEQVLQSLAKISRSLDENQRLVVLLDPSRHFDEATTDFRKLRVLRDIVRSLPDRVHVIIALRESDPAVYEADLLHLGVEIYRDLEPFEPADIHDLLRQVFGEHVPYEVAHAVSARYGGDPFTTGLAVNLARTDPGEPLRALVDRVPGAAAELMRMTHDRMPTTLDQRILRILGLADEPVGIDFVRHLLGGETAGDAIYRALHGPAMSWPVVRVPALGNRSRYRIFHSLLAEFLGDLARDFGDWNTLHQRAGSYFQLHGDTPKALHHFSHAQDVDGVGATIEKGLDWHRRYGETRRLRALYERLREIELTPRHRFALTKAQAWALSMAGETDEVVTLVEDLLPQTEAESVERAELLLLRGDCYHNSSRYEESFRDFNESRDLLERLGHADTLMYRQVVLEVAHMATHLGKFASSVRDHDRLWRSQRRADDGDPDTAEHHHLQYAREIRRYGEVLVFTGEWELAEQLLESARETFREIEYRIGEANALRRLADLCLLRGSPGALEQAIAFTHRARELMVETGSRGASWMDLVEAEARRGQGDLDRALRLHRHSYQSYLDGSSPHLLSMAEIGLAECERMRDGVLPRERYDEALERYRGISFTWGIATALLFRGAALRATGDASAADDDLDAADRLFEDLELTPPRDQILRIRSGEPFFLPLIVL